MIDRDAIVEMLNRLEAYVDGGIRDYLRDNSVIDYIDHGNFDDDYQLLLAVRRVLSFVASDEYAWWEGH